MEQRGPAGEPLFAPLRVGDRETPLGICAVLDHVGWLLCSEGARPAASSRPGIPQNASGTMSSRSAS
jgi:hypothetical protein